VPRAYSLPPSPFLYLRGQTGGQSRARENKNTEPKVQPSIDALGPDLFDSYEPGINPELITNSVIIIK
jgi:hypothetical protein